MFLRRQELGSPAIVTHTRVRLPRSAHYNVIIKSVPVWRHHRRHRLWGPITLHRYSLTLAGVSLYTRRDRHHAKDLLPRHQSLRHSAYASSLDELLPRLPETVYAGHTHRRHATLIRLVHLHTKPRFVLIISSYFRLLDHLTHQSTLTPANPIQVTMTYIYHYVYCQVSQGDMSMS